MPKYKPNDAGTEGLDRIQRLEKHVADSPTLTPSSSLDNVIQPTAAGTVPLVLKAAAGQTADLLQIQDQSGAVIGGFSAAGGLNGGSQPAAARAIAFAGFAATVKQGYSAPLLVVGDSTGVGTTRWPYLFAQWLATQYPAATVWWRPFDVSNVLWDTAPTVIQTGAAGTRYVTFDGTTQTGGACSATTYNNIVGDLDLRIQIKPTSWTPSAAMELISRYPDSSNRSCRLELGTNGKLTFAWSANGTAEVAALQSSVAVGFTGVQGGLLRAVFQASNGGNATVTFYTAPDGPIQGATWTQLGTQQSSAGTSSIFSSTTSAWEIGARNGGTVSPFGGGIAEVEVHAGVNGPIVCPVWPEQWQRTNSNYNAVISGAPVIDIWNGSWSGGSLSSQFIPNDAQMVPAIAAATAILNTGKNETTLDPGLWALYDTLANYVKATNPSCGIAVTAQNPSISPITQANIDQLAIRLAKIEGYAHQRGYTTIPVYTAFQQSPLGLAALTNVDGIHPSDASGSPLWAQTVEALYTAAAAYV